MIPSQCIPFIVVRSQTADLFMQFRVYMCNKSASTTRYTNPLSELYKKTRTRMHLLSCNHSSEIDVDRGHMC